MMNKEKLVRPMVACQLTVTIIGTYLLFLGVFNDSFDQYNSMWLIIYGFCCIVMALTINSALLQYRLWQFEERKKKEPLSEDEKKRKWKMGLWP